MITRLENQFSRHTKWFVAAGLFALVATPVGAQAPGFGAGARQDPSEIEAKAKSLQEQPKQYRRAAELYLQAADLRTAAEPQRVENRKMAARLFYYAGDATRARVLMEEAGNGALAAGDILKAAHTYLDASVLARDSGAKIDANRLAEKAELLMKSPVIGDADRQEVLARIVRKSQSN